MEVTIPETLTHYFNEIPFQTLSDQPAESRASIIANMQRTGNVPYRLTHCEYLPRRLRIEDQMHTAFVAQGGRPKRKHPHYLVLGRSPIWEKMTTNQIELPIHSIPSNVISFTLTDSFYTFSPTTLRGIVIPPKPHRQRIYTLESLKMAIEEHGMPPGYEDQTEEFDTYIETQIWDDEPLETFIDTWHC